jgi:multidrug efflux pump
MSFNPSVWPIKNRRAMYVITLLLTAFGYMAYQGLAKEQFPEIKFPQLIVQTIYPGTSPENMENLVTKPLEKQLKNLSGIKKVTSNSFQDFSVIVAEFNTDVEIPKAKKDVEDAVSKAKADPNGLPKNLPQDPSVKEIDVSELPIMFVNISGNYDLARLERYADKIKEEIESLKEIKRVEKVGGLEREIQVNVDVYKMQAAQLSFRDIQSAISYENVEATPGQVTVEGEQRILSIKQTFKSVDEIANVIVKNPFGAEIVLKDIAEVKDTYKDQESFARLDTKNVLTLNIIKAGGQNLIQATDKIYGIVDSLKATELPKELNVVITGEQADATRTTLHDLINTIIIGFILVVIILMFFMGTTNAIFVGLSVPLSCAIAFIVLSGIGFTLNMIVLFAFLLALGIVVDDAIVVIENAHRILHDEKLSIFEATKKATAEVFLPVLTGTITTLVPFVPLAFWKGTIGEFMFYLPITLIITLLASLVVAYFINPVFAVDFMEEDHAPKGKIKMKRSDWITIIICAAVGIIGHGAKSAAFGNFMFSIIPLFLLNKFILSKLIHKFQTKIWPGVQNAYVRLLTWLLNHKWVAVVSTVVIFVFTIMLFGARTPNVVFFPGSEPNFAYLYLSLPEGTDQNKTNEVLKQLEDKVYKTLDMDVQKGIYNPLVKSVISNVKVGATDQQSGEIGEYANRGKITVSFVKFAERKGKSTQALLDKLRANVKNIPGAKISIDKEQGGPPTPKPILIEITGEKLDALITASKDLKRYLDNAQIDGVEELKSDFQANKPELQFSIDRSRVNTEGISTGQITQDLRTAMFGAEVSRFKDANDDYPIMLRLKPEQRNNIDVLRNLNVTYRDFGMGGMVRNVPISGFGSIQYTNTYGGIKRKDEKRIITISSNVLGGFNPNQVVANVQSAINDYKASGKIPDDVNLRMGGEQEEQAETMSFLGAAMGISILLIIILLMVQFNSLKRMAIIISEIVLSIIGVLLGFAIFKMDMSIVMTGIGIVALAGIVVRNGILLVEFFDLKLASGSSVREAVLEAGRTRMTPVLLTATATMLGLVPLAVGLNIDFATLFASGKPNLFFGGDSVAFWGPLSWTMIFGLSFATLLTLILVPVMLDAFIRNKKTPKLEAES